MKLKNISLCTVPIALALTLTGCNYVEAAIGEAKSASVDPSVGPNMTKGKVIEVEDGSYTKVRASDDLRNSLEDTPVLDEYGDDSGLGSSLAKSAIVEYYYRYFIDSTALEGGPESLKAWRAAALKQGVHSDTKHSKDWLKDPTSMPVLTTAGIAPNRDLKSFINDGDPRMTGANLKFGDEKIALRDTSDGVVVRVPVTWDVAYRITDETLLDMLRAKNPDGTDEEILEGLTDEAQDGKGENALSVSGSSDYDVLLTEDGPKIYALGVASAHSYGDAVRPEFQKGGARYMESNN